MAKDNSVFFAVTTVWKNNMETDNGRAKTSVKTTAPQLTSVAANIDSITHSQLEHALDGQRRGLKVYESLRSLNEIIGTQYGDRVLFELLQNAHAAHAPGEKGEVAIHLVVADDHTGVLLVANKGRPFSDSNKMGLIN